jgi:hypothetical protein
VGPLCALEVVYLHVVVALDVVLPGAAVVGDGTGVEVDHVADDAGVSDSLEELRQRAVAGLVGAQCRDHGIAVE